MRTLIWSDKFLRAIYTAKRGKTYEEVFGK